MAKQIKISSIENGNIAEKAERIAENEGKIILAYPSAIKGKYLQQTIHTNKTTNNIQRIIVHAFLRMPAFILIQQ